MRKVLLTTSALLFVTGASAFAQDAATGVWRLVPEGEAIVTGDCVVAEGGTTQFQPSGQDDAPQNDTAGTGCPPGMMPATPVVDGSSDDNSEPVEADDTEDGDDSAPANGETNGGG